MIDLAALKREAAPTKEPVVVTRRWLRQVLKELSAARAASQQVAVLDLRLPELKVHVRPLERSAG